MNCPEYQELTPKEKAIFIGEIVHCVQNCPRLFHIGRAIIQQGQERGLFENVQIFPNSVEKKVEENLEM